MLADKLYRDLAAALVGDVGHLLGCREPLDGHRDDLVFLLGAGTTHLHLPVFAIFYGGDVLGGCFDRALGVHPEDELVKRQHRDGRDFLPVERDVGAERCGEQVRQGDDQLVRVAVRNLDIEEGFGAGATRFVHHHHRLLHQLVLGDDALNEARHLVGAAARTGGNQEFNRLRRLPPLRHGCVGLEGRRRKEQCSTVCKRSACHA